MESKKLESLNKFQLSILENCLEVQIEGGTILGLGFMGIEGNGQIPTLSFRNGGVEPFTDFTVDYWVNGEEDYDDDGNDLVTSHEYYIKHMKLTPIYKNINKIK